MISVIAPLTQAGLNPARDFGPRLFAYFAGWGPIAIPGPRGGFFTVYILSPIIGGLIGAAGYEFLLRPAMILDGQAAKATEAMSGLWWPCLLRSLQRGVNDRRP